jgi:hypothetical protein
MRPVESPLFSGQRDLTEYPPSVPESLDYTEARARIVEVTDLLQQFAIGDIIRAICQTNRSILSTNSGTVFQEIQTWNFDDTCPSGLSPLKQVGIKKIASFHFPRQSITSELPSDYWVIYMKGQIGEIKMDYCFCQREDGRLLPIDSKLPMSFISPGPVHFTYSLNTAVGKGDQDVYDWRAGGIVISSDGFIVRGETGGAELTQIHYVPDVVLGQDKKLIKIERPDYVSKLCVGRNRIFSPQLDHTTFIAEVAGKPVRPSSQASILIHNKDGEPKKLSVAITSLMEPASLCDTLWFLPLAGPLNHPPFSIQPGEFHGAMFEPDGFFGIGGDKSLTYR